MSDFGVEECDLLAQDPDLNPTEPLWDTLERTRQIKKLASWAGATLTKQMQRMELLLIPFIK